MKVFVALGLVAGALNYAYQLLASHYLPLSDFAEFGAWFARVSMLLTPAVALQYFANFRPLNGRPKQIVLVLTNICLLALWIGWSVLPTDLGASHAAILILSAAAFGWLSGQAQIGLHLTALATAGVVLAATKVLGILAVSQASPAAFASPLFYAYLPAAWALTFVLWRAGDVPPKTSAGGAGQIVAILVLSVASACLPQIDLAVLHHTASESEFALFALASLFYRAIYFVVLAFLQWLFPHQVRGVAKRLTPRRLVRLGCFAVVGSGLVAFVGPSLGQMILGWAAAPPESWVFLGCLNIALLTWIYVALQADCAAGNVKPALGALLFVGAETLIQFYLRLSVLPYLLTATLCQFVLATIQARRGPVKDSTKGAFGAP